MPEDNKNSNQFDDSFLDETMNDIPPAPARSIPVHDKPKGFKAKLKDIFVNPKKRKVLIGSTLVILVVLAVVPQSRYFMLNTAGVRSSASVKVLDQSTGQPLRNVAVSIAGQEQKTNEDGVAKLQELKLGSTKLTIQKRAFAVTDKTIVVGLGSNPLGDFSLEPVGVQYTFNVQDFLSAKSIEKAEAVSGEYSAFSDAKGKLVLTIEEPGEDSIDITIKAEGYRDEDVAQTTENKEVQTVSMVPERKHLFVSKRSGKYDVYKIDVDGKNEELVLSGTGNERDDMTLVPHPEKDIAALVSTRESTRNKDGFLLSTLSLIDLTGTEPVVTSLGNSEKIQLIGWSGDQLVYVKIRSGASAETPDRHQLVTYNYESGQTKELAKSNYFNDVLLVGENIYYAPSSAYTEGEVGFYKVTAKGENQKTIFPQEVWNIFRTDYNKIEFSVQDDWYEISTSDDKVLASSGAPVSQLTRVYIEGPQNDQSLWIDQRDGKGALVDYNTSTKEEKVLKSQSGLTYPARWMNSKTIVYRISNDQESADYVINIEGGEARKIKDVTNTGGVDRWYYY